jgi:Mn2+/Fe2+ NRAMP family transporter
VTRKGLGDLIREHYGVRVSVFIFTCLFLANIATIIVDLAAVKIVGNFFHVPVFPAILIMVFVALFVVIKGNYKVNQNIMLIVSLFYFAYIISAFKSNPDWWSAASNLVVPHGAPLTWDYVRNYFIIGMGVLGTTITPWGQFFISSFAFDKKIEMGRLRYSQFETYWGAFITNFFSFFMVVATAATLYIHNIPLESGEQAALAIAPFAGELAGTLFTVGILMAGFMGVITVTLSTAYAFAEFFGVSGSLDASFERGRAFYSIFVIQLVVAGIFVMIPSISLLKLAVISQAFNAMMLPFIFYYVIKLTNSRHIMGTYANNEFQRKFATVSTVIISLASVIALTVGLFGI